MARKSPSQRKQPQPESKKALIIFLVFFILTTIGGGLFGYQGYIADEGKQNQINTEKGKVKQTEEDRDFYKYQTLLLRRKMGQEKQGDKDQLDKLDKQFKEATEDWTRHKDRNEVVALVAEIDKRLNTVAPGKTTYEAALTQALASADAAKNAVAPHLKEKNVGNEEAATAKALLEDAKVQNAKNLKEVSDKLNVAQQQDVEQRKQLKKELDDAATRFEELSKAKADVEKQRIRDIEAKNADIKRYLTQIADLSNDLALLKGTKKNSEGVEVEIPVAAVGRVVDRKNDTAFIDLGVLQGMTPQMTFSIHAMGGDGQPLRTSKGTLEVTNVFESGSQARISLEKSKSDPIQSGDVIVNPNWNPNRKRHVAIKGIVDLTGEGRNQMREFRQMLERQNIVVDAYVESTGNTWVLHGGISKDTNYLILGSDALDTKAMGGVVAPGLKQKNDQLERSRSRMAYCV